MAKNRRSERDARYYRHRYPKIRYFSTEHSVIWLYRGIRVYCFELARNRSTKIQILHGENEFVFDRAMALFEFINQPPGFGKSYINDYLTCFTIDPVGP